MAAAAAAGVAAIAAAVVAVAAAVEEEVVATIRRAANRFTSACRLPTPSANVSSARSVQPRSVRRQDCEETG